jgi:hypothetical protein
MLRPVVWNDCHPVGRSIPPRPKGRGYEIQGLQNQKICYAYSRIDLPRPLGRGTGNREIVGTTGRSIHPPQHPPIYKMGCKGRRGTQQSWGMLSPLPMP